MLRSRSVRAAYLFVLPYLVLFAVFRWGPAVGSVVLSTGDYRLSGDFTFLGLDHYDRLVHDPVFWGALRVTVVYLLMAVPATVVLGLGMALLTRRAIAGVRVFRALYFLPVITSLVLAGIVWRWIYADDGPISSGLRGLGLPAPAWLRDAGLVLVALALLSVWNRFGFGMLILLAGLLSIPRELDEAALVDGATAWQRFRHVTLPQLRPAIFFVVVVETVFSFQVFDTVYVMTGGGPVRASYSLVYMVYDQGIKSFDYGYASAVGLVLFAMTLSLALVQRRVLGRQA